MNQVNTIAGAMIFMFFVFYLLAMARPSEEDIRACMEATNYDEDRCIFEMTR